MTFCLVAGVPFAPTAWSEPEPVPRMQVVPQPGHQVSLQREGQEIARYHFGADFNRPFVFPLIGPSGPPVIWVSGGVLSTSTVRVALAAF